MNIQMSIKSTRPPIVDDFAILHGSLAPKGCVVRLNGATVARRDGTARVFAHESDLMNAIDQAEIRSGHILVLRSGFDLSNVMRALMSNGLGHVSVIAEDRYDGPHQSPVISGISPTAAQGGAIGLVKDDDVIRIDIEKRQLDVLSNVTKRQEASPSIKKAFGPSQKYQAMFNSDDA